MKRFLLAMASVLVMAIPAFAENWVGPIDSEIQNDSLLADYGPIRMKPLMIYTSNGSGGYTPYFGVGQTIWSHTNWQIKGTGGFRLSLETRDSAGVLIDQVKIGWPTPLTVSSRVFQNWNSVTNVSNGVPATPGYYTLRVAYIDAATGNTWSHKTKIQLLAP